MALDFTQWKLKYFVEIVFKTKGFIYCFLGFGFISGEESWSGNPGHGERRLVTFLQTKPNISAWRILHRIEKTCQGSSKCWHFKLKSLGYKKNKARVYEPCKSKVLG